jgi:YidC/Oxa1 family membrane protein insertase
VDFSAFPLIAAVLDAAHAALLALVGILEPVAGSLSAALAIVLVTLVVRAALIPLGALQVRGEVARRRLAPKIAELRRRHKNPETLQRKTLELYQKEGVSPFAGLWPALAQAPVVSVLYGVAVSAQLNGHPNELLTQTLFGAPLGVSLPGMWASPSLAVLVPVALLAVMAVVAWFTRRQTLRLADGEGGGVPGALSWLSFTTVVIATFVPLAAALYLTVSTTWTFVERTLLRRRLGA